MAQLNQQKTYQWSWEASPSLENTRKLMDLYAIQFDKICLKANSQRMLPTELDECMSKVGSHRSELSKGQMKLRQDTDYAID